MTASCTTPSRRRRIAIAWALHTEWLEWPFTTKRELRRRAKAAADMGFHLGVERTLEAAHKVSR